jgi:AhpD family alkylhydroperoxidase
MSAPGPVEYRDAIADVRAVFDDIKRTRRVEDVNNFWKYLAHDPASLKRTWDSVKEIMTPGALDAVTKEMIYLAVSVTNGCGYCIASHGAAARKAGMTEAMFGELMAVVGTVISFSIFVLIRLFSPAAQEFLPSLSVPIGSFSSLKKCGIACGTGRSYIRCDVARKALRHAPFDHATMPPSHRCRWPLHQEDCRRRRALPIRQKRSRLLDMAIPQWRPLVI